MHRALGVAMLALGSQGMRMGMLAAIARQLEQDIFMVAAPLTAARWMGFIFGAPALSAGIAQALTGLWMDKLGMRRIMLASNVLSWVGAAMCLSVDAASQGVWALWLFFAGMIFLGLGGGGYETVNNTLVPTLYAEDRVRKMSQLHAWWPGGMLLGTLCGAALLPFDLDWRLAYALSLLPIVALTLWVPGTVYPDMRQGALAKAWAGQAESEPKRPPQPQHQPQRDLRWAELRRFGFIWMLVCMALGAAVELLPPPWFSITLSRTTGVTGATYLLLVFSAMFILRQGLALYANRLPPMRLLHLSALLALAGFLLMARATEAWQGVLAVLLWAAGCSAFWPTMMVLMSQRHAKAGALGIGLLGTMGTLADFAVQPLFGHIYDRAKIAAAGGQEAFAALTHAGDTVALEAVFRIASHHAFYVAALLPLALIPALFVLGRAKSERQAEAKAS